jgi:hypothetical protein
MAKIIVQENEIAILTIWGKIHNLNFNPIKFDGFSKSQRIEKLNKIAISQMRILSGLDVKELETKGDY